MTTLQTLSLTFDLPLAHEGLRAFRGAMAALVGKEEDLFHNHNNAEEGSNHYKHRYPLIQYRVKGGQAAIMGINQGAEALQTLLNSGQLSRFSLNGNPLPLSVIHSHREGSFPLELLPNGSTRKYRIYRYVPFDTDNYRRYKDLHTLREKVDFLENLMQNHVVTCLQSLGMDLSENAPLKLTLNDLDRTKKVNALGVPLMAFDLVFSVNTTLPEGLGLGRKTAFGFGWIIPLPN